MTDELIHEGTPRHSGRYPWGSGDTPEQRNRSFTAYIKDMKAKGLTEVEIAKGMGLNTTQLRAKNFAARNANEKADIALAVKLNAKGMSNVAIGERMGRNESYVRTLLNPEKARKADESEVLVNLLKDEVKAKKFLDVGEGTENHIGVNQQKLKTAVQMLKDEGYKLDYVNVDQLGTNHKTLVKVLHDGTTSYSDLLQQQDQIRSVANWIDKDTGKAVAPKPPIDVDLKRVGVRYKEDGGADADGVMYIRRGVPDLSMGDSKYAQVRVAVGGTHYLKGMAIYKDGLPDGVDIEFNTNKSSMGNKLDAMKPQKNDPQNRFGSMIKRQRDYVDVDGKTKQSALNIVNEEGDWHEWNAKLSSQMLSKQSPRLAREQLDLTYASTKMELDEIKSLTNPAVRRRLLETYADKADSAAVRLKAAGLPRTRSQVILPINSLKDNEVFAPQYKNGEMVALVRHPHGGKFEIPELRVNNRNPEGKALLSQARDAIGINSKVAGRLSGADFDGDTVLVIPNSHGKVKSEPALAGLKNFDPAIYRDTSLPPMTGASKQHKMGDISNLITDMTIMGANNTEIAAAVRHSMVVIDAEKHSLNYKQSYADNGIGGLKVKYQGSAKAGATTLISLAKKDMDVPVRKPRKAALGGPINPVTGRREYTETGESYVDKKTGLVVNKTMKTPRILEVDDANELSSGQPMEIVYANHANKLKALANEARKEYVSTKPMLTNKSAKKVFAPEVSSLNAKLNIALKNAPLERQAQIFANAQVKAKTQATPDMDKAELKKIKGQALQIARDRVGANKERVQITDGEWKAIQAGAITPNKLDAILRNADIEAVRKLATPREALVMNPAKVARAQAMLANGYEPSEIADAIGVSTSTLSSSLNRKED